MREPELPAEIGMLIVELQEEMFGWLTTDGLRKTLELCVDEARRRRLEAQEARGMENERAFLVY